MTTHYRVPYTFYGDNRFSYQRSRVVILPVPYEGSVSYQHGTSGGPHAILTASRQVEWYDIELGREVPDTAKVHTLAEMEPMTDSVRDMIESVRKVTERNIQKKKFQLMFGGEHSVSLGAIQAYQAKYRDMSILQIDAHSDLRDTWENSAYNHACVMRRAAESVKRVVQVGIRSQDSTEALYASEHKDQIRIFYGDDVPVKKISESLSSRVYVTIDVDGLDPSIMPATGTPEPGGLSWKQLITLLRFVAQSHTIIGADIVELSPLSSNAAPDFLTAKLAHKLIAYTQFKRPL
ncbi:MAG: agmatinase [Parcubacteria group bacterium]